MPVACCSVASGPSMIKVNKSMAHAEINLEVSIAEFEHGRLEYSRSHITLKEITKKDTFFPLLSCI